MIARHINEFFLLMRCKGFKVLYNVLVDGRIDYFVKSGRRIINRAYPIVHGIPQKYDFPEFRIVN